MKNNEKTNKTKIENKVNEVIDAYKNLDNRIKSDVDGSYTGVPLDELEQPVQDADDL